MADRVQFRRDTAANWTAYNPILLEGELGFELDTDQYKLGDGIHNWSVLPYRGAPCVQQRGTSTTTPMSQKAVTDELKLIAVFDISAYNLTDGQPTKYADLTAALGTHGDNIPNVPTQYRVPGMTIRYIQSSDNKYVQYRLMADSWSDVESDWQGVDDEPVSGSENLVKSGGVFEAIQNNPQNGYYVCETSASTAAKEVSAAGYVLSIGGSIKIKMTNANTADNATLNINSTGAKPLYYDGERASVDNSWEAGETVDVYYDGTNFYANNVAVGEFSTGEKVKEVGIDDEPISESGNLVKSGGIYQYIEGKIYTSEIHITDTIGTFSLTPNTFYIFDNIIEDINIVLGTPMSGKLNEYNLEFTCDENSHINFPNTLRWIDDEPLEPEQGYTYQVSIVDELAVYGAWEGGQNE